MAISVIKISRDMACFECGTKVKFGLTHDGRTVFRIVCKRCMAEWRDGLDYFLATGKFGEIIKNDEEENEEKENEE